MGVSKSNQTREWWVCVFSAQTYFHLVKRFEILDGSGLNGVMLGLKRLDDGGTAARAASDTSGNLGQYLKSALSGAEIRDGEARVPLDHTDKSDLRNIQALSNHLGSDKHP